jgi:alpha-D-ribose 1-methylphosphonate 5-triphosphate diphosphatase
MDGFEIFGHDPLVKLISLMDHTPGQRQFVSLDAYKLYYKSKKGFTDEQMAEFIEKRRARADDIAPRNRKLLSAIAAEHGVIIASHDDATVAHVDEAVSLNTRIAEFPTTLEAARASHAAGMGVLMGGPNVVRGGSHSGNVAAAELARLGLLDILSSDYVPASLLGAVLRLVQDGICSMPAAVAMVTRNPARATGLHDRGSLEPGLRGDVVQVRLVDLPDGSRHGVVRGVWRQGVRVL